MTERARIGFLYGLLAYVWWGMVPLYFVLLRRDVAPDEILAQRVIWSLAFLTGIMFWLGRWRLVSACLRSASMLTLTATSILIAANWFTYIYSAVNERIREASLGFYITPLVSVILGIVFYRERLRRLQWLALGFGVLGVALLTRDQGTLPWVAVVLSVTFGIYGLMRKRLTVDPLVGLFVETLMLAPLALCYLCYLGWSGNMVFGHVSYWFDMLFLVSGVVTATPLMAFGQAASRLPLSTLGFLQYISPTLQLSIAVLLFQEPFDAAERISFLCIGAGLVVFSFDSYREFRRATVVIERDDADVLGDKEDRSLGR